MQKTPVIIGALILLIASAALLIFVALEKKPVPAGFLSQEEAIVRAWQYAGPCSQMGKLSVNDAVLTKMYRYWELERANGPAEEGQLDMWVIEMRGNFPGSCLPGIPAGFEPVTYTQLVVVLDARDGTMRAESARYPETELDISALR